MRLWMKSCHWLLEELNKSPLSQYSAKRYFVTMRYLRFLKSRLTSCSSWLWSTWGAMVGPRQTFCTDRISCWLCGQLERFWRCKVLVGRRVGNRVRRQVWGDLLVVQLLKVKMDWYLGTNLHHEVLEYDDQKISRPKSHLFSEIWCGAGKWSNTLVQLWQTSPERFPVKY